MSYKTHRRDHQAQLMRSDDPQICIGRDCARFICPTLNDSGLCNRDVSSSWLRKYCVKPGEPCLYTPQPNPPPSWKRLLLTQKD